MVVVVDVDPVVVKLSSGVVDKTEGIVTVDASALL